MKMGRAHGEPPHRLVRPARVHSDRRSAAVLNGALQTHVHLRAPHSTEGRFPRSKLMSTTPRLEQDQLACRSSATVFRLEPRVRCERVNRIVNLSLAILVSILLLPVFAAIAAAIKLSSPGPVLYTQTRLGLDRRRRRKIPGEQRRSEDLGGQPFVIYKFRSMRLDAETKTGAVWATTNDPRVTPIGSVLRKYHLDEMPQLINIIRGEMNCVGPRPERPSIAVRLRESIDEYPLRHRVKPGITGLAQITQRYDSCLDDVRQKVGYDVQYLRRQSLRLDLAILLRTAPAVLSNTRAERSA